MLNSLRYLISNGLAQAGYSSTIVAPVLSIFTLLESELAMSNFQFSSALEEQFQKLDQAILLSTDQGEGIEDPDFLDEDEEEEEDDWYDDEYEDDLDDDDDDE
jgi:hypothetical protein